MAIPESDDQDLRCMERLKAGDDLALNELMQRWKGPLVRFCQRYTGNTTDALEMAQETFVRVYTARHRYRAEAAFSTWLFGIAANLGRMRSRWRMRHPEVLEADRDPEGKAPLVAMDANDPALDMDRRAMVEDLSVAIRELPHDLRVVFVLSELEGHAHKQTASILGITAKAVERRLARARAQLRAMLENKWNCR